MEKLKKILRSFGLVAAFFFLFIATAGALNAGGIYLWAGIVNGIVEAYVLIRLFVKLMDEEKVL